MRTSFLCWFLLTLDQSIQHKFATLSEVVGSFLILPISENDSSHINKNIFFLKIHHVVYQIEGNFALIKNNNRKWVVKSIVFLVFFFLFVSFYIACVSALFHLLFVFSACYLQRMAYAYLVTLQFDLFFWPRRNEPAFIHEPFPQSYIIKWRND